MATCLNEVTTNMLKNPSIRDVMCPVCRGIFIEPVSMPCHHALCLQCFRRTMEENSLTCPLCRKRIGGWLRTATKEHNLVNNELWASIQKFFPEQVQAKLKGHDDGVEEHVIGQVSTHISSTGEIRKEYELQVKKLEEENRKKFEAERTASETLIRKIQEEEEKQYLALKQQLKKQAAADEQLAKELQEQATQSTSGLLIKKDAGSSRAGMDNKENKNRSHGSATTQIRGPMDSYLFTQAKKSSASNGKFLTTSDNSFNVQHISKLKTSSEIEKLRSASNLSTCSHDSINQEMHHFKPIKSVPRTPPKKLSDSRVLVPMVVKAVPMDLNPLYETLAGSSGSETYVSSSFRQQLQKIQQERNRQPKASLRVSDVYPPVSAFRGKAHWQRPETCKAKCDIEQSTEDMESPRKKARQDTSSEGQRTNFTLSELSSYSNEDCEGKKVIAIVHNQVDALAEGEGKIGGHDRRFGGSEKEDSCSYNPSNKESMESDDEFGVVDYENPDVTRIIGVDPEINSQPFEIESSSRNRFSPVMCSSGMKLNMDKLSIYPSTRPPLNRYKAGYHTNKNNGKNHLNNNDISNVVPSKHSKNSQVLAEEKSSGMCKDKLDEILPIIDGDSSALLNEQTHIELMIRQEQEDFELALRLSREWEIADRIVDRSKGSLRAYELRNTYKSQKKKKEISKSTGNNRQSTLEESFAGTVRTRKR